MAQEQLKIADFSGGITDYYLDGPLNCAHVLGNFVLTRQGKLIPRPGCVHYDDSDLSVGAGNVRTAKIFELNDTLFIVQASELYRYSAGTWTEVTGSIITDDDYTDGSTLPLFNGNTADNFVNVVVSNGHAYLTSDSLTSRPKVLYQDSGGTWRLRTYGLPHVWEPFDSNGFATTPPFSIYTAATPGGAEVTGSETYVYAFHYYLSYTTIDGKRHIENGPVQYLEITDAEDIDAGYIMHIIPDGANWPKPENGEYDFYATGTAAANRPLLVVYRYPQAGGEPHYRTRLNAGEQSPLYIQDSTTDANLLLISPLNTLPTEGDVVDNTPPPLSKYVSLCNQIFLYGNVKFGTASYPNRVYQAIQNAPHFSPEDAFVELDDPNTGLGVAGNYHVAFCQSRAYRLEGYIDELGSGHIRKIVISDKIGCISADSIIQSQVGCAFAAEDGFYFTDGFTLQKISGNITKERYPIISSTTAGGSVTGDVKRGRISGAYDPYTDRYLWAVFSSEAGTDNAEIYVFDANFGIKEDGCFTVWSGDGWQPSALYMQGRNLLRANGSSTAELFKHSESYLSDTSVGALTKVHIAYDYQSCAWSFGDETAAKYVTHVQASFLNEGTDLSVQIQSCNNDLATWTDLKVVRLRDQSGALLAERRFPSGGLRAIYKQVRIKNALVVCYTSDEETGTATVSGTTVTRSGSADWPDFLQLYGMSIYFSDDSYVTGYPITAVHASGDNITAATLSGLDGSGKEWVIKGYPKNEEFHLLGYVITFERFGNTLRGYPRGHEGGNA